MLKIFDDFLNEQEWNMFVDAQYWQDRHRNTWSTLRKAPKYFYEHLSIKIWMHYANLGDDELLALARSLGFEYWTHILTKENNLEWHRDKDEELYAEMMEFYYPTCGAILYGQHDDLVGGLLEINNGDGTFDTVDPVPNRLVLFDAGKLHRVTDIEQGTRRAFSCNLWDTKIKAYEIDAD